MASHVPCSLQKAIESIMKLACFLFLPLLTSSMMAHGIYSLLILLFT